MIGWSVHTKERDRKRVEDNTERQKECCYTSEENIGHVRRDDESNESKVIAAYVEFDSQDK